MKKKVAILGVTGSVGQEFVQSLNEHPWFEVTQIAASDRSAGKKYLEAIRNDSGIIAWDVAGKIPDYIKEMEVLSIDEIDITELDLVFSAIESGAALDIETKFAKDLPVISTSSAYRYEEDVPILIPGVNDDHAELLEVQRAALLGVELVHPPAEQRLLELQAAAQPERSRSAAASPPACALYTNVIPRTDVIPKTNSFFILIPFF